MNTKPILRWMTSFLMWTLAIPCPNTPDSICRCDETDSLTFTCYSTKTNETIFRARQVLHPIPEQMICLNLLCKNDAYLEDYFNVPIPKPITCLQINHCSLTKEWGRNLINSNIDILEIEKVNYFPTEGSIELFRLLPELHVLYIEKTKFLNLTYETFEYLTNLDHMHISFTNLTTISHRSFVHLQNRTHLVLFKNNIKYLPDSIFQDLPYLQTLDLSKNSLKNLPENLLVKNINLEILDLEGNQLTQLPQNLLQNSKRLRELDINKNPLQQIPSDLLKNNANLRNFLASDCNLTSIPEGLFENAVNLNYLNLRGNNLNFITNKYFKTNTLLWIIDLSFNRISQLIDSPFQYNRKLEKLDIKRNKLENITRKDFFGLKSLYELDISDNFISNIEETSFQDLINLDQLNMEFNRLKFLKADYFKASTLLRTIKLSYNEISELLNSPFQFNTELRELNLYSNKLSNISKSDFSGLRSLKALNVSSNLLSDIEEFSFEDMDLLERFDISFNFLKRMPDIHHPNKTLGLSYFIANNNHINEFPNITQYRKLRELRLEENQITSLSIPTDFSPQKGNTFVYLQNNTIETINVNSIKFDHDHDYDYDDMINRTSLRKKVLFHLEGNPLICDCDLYEFSVYISRNVFCLRHALFSDAHILTCKGPQNLKGEILKKLHKDDFICPVTEKCPAGCRCTFRKRDSAVIMHCDGLEMNALPEVIPENIKILHMENNRLKGLKELKREELRNLTELYVDGNRLSSENSAQWYIPRHLRVLSLTGNNLKFLPEPIKRHDERMKDFQIYLRNNSWKCDCSGAHLRHWIHDHLQQVRDNLEILCMIDGRDGMSPRFRELMKLSHDALCPFDHSPFIRQRILGASVILVLGFICAVSVIFYNMKKKKLLSYIYIHFSWLFKCLYNRDGLDSDKTFDAFISYSSDDRDVAIEISNELEKKEPYYRLCIHERDWMAGVYITENIISSVKNSRKTILIISNNFLGSRWCDMEFDVAFNQTLADKMPRLILIVKGDFPQKNIINGDMRFMLATKTYITWGEVLFWQKLRSALDSNFLERHYFV